MDAQLTRLQLLRYTQSIHSLDQKNETFFDEDKREMCMRDMQLGTSAVLYVNMDAGNN
jgi:hypothetical protein